MTIPEVQEEIVQEFAMFDDWAQKYEYLIECGKHLGNIDPRYKSQEFLVRGCQSQVWLYASYIDGKVNYQVDSDAIIVKGLAALVMRVYNHRSPDEILDHPPTFIEKIGMQAHLSPTRSNGLLSMVKHVQSFALAFKTKYSQP
ncbi:MAG: SufE family protein [Bacteroidetes bacterium]|jgi:cysteine desulfuration protein SufE|nr:SufE family protein [Bacteroidota bacterium]